LKNIIIDAGPIIALFDKSDKYHKNIIEYFKNEKGKLFSTWPVITEAMHFLKFNVEVQIDFLTWLSIGTIQIIDINSELLDRIIEIVKKYSDIPIDLADASLLSISELLGIKNIITIDSEYYFYKTKNRELLNNLLEDYL
jgi:uncharacterized protein